MLSRPVQTGTTRQVLGGLSGTRVPVTTNLPEGGRICCLLPPGEGGRGVRGCSEGVYEFIMRMNHDSCDYLALFQSFGVAVILLVNFIQWCLIIKQI